MRLTSAIAIAAILCAAAPLAPAMFAPNDWGFDSTGLDRTAKPGDGFDRYANGAWQDRTAIPLDRQGWYLTSALRDAAEANVRSILEATARNPVRDDTTVKMGAYYASAMDEGRIERLGLQPIAEDLARIRAANSREALAVLMARTNLDFYGSLVRIQVLADLKTPSVYAAYIGQPDLGLPDRDYYLNSTFAPKKAAYQTYVADLLRLAGWADPDPSAKNIVAFENALAQASWTRTEQRDLAKQYSPRSAQELARQAPGFAWAVFLRAGGLPDHVIAQEVSALPKIAAIYARTPLPALRAWHAFTLVDHAAPFLSRAFAERHFQFHDQTLAGTEVQAPRWKRAVLLVSGGDFLSGQPRSGFGSMGWAVGEEYSRRYFPATAKAKMVELVENLRAAYRARLQAADWMAPGTRAEALRKLAALKLKVGFPDRPQRDYSPLRIDRADLVGNIRRTAAYEWGIMRARVGRPIEPGEWLLTPQTVDAYNGAVQLDIAFPAALLQPPVFSDAADAALNYGAIGAAIGHEMTHNFDDQGRALDATGALRGWWTSTDAAEFRRRASVLGAQFSHFEPFSGAHVNGDLTMGENIADLVGLIVAHDAYVASLHGKPAPVIDGWTGDQRFFLGWAQFWRGKSREAAMRRQLVADPHAPARYRIDGAVRNIDAWYDAFHVRSGDALYVAPGDRARFW